MCLDISWPAVKNKPLAFPLLLKSHTTFISADPRQKCVEPWRWDTAEMGKVFLTTAALRDTNGGKFGLTMTIMLCTSLITGDLPFLTKSLCHRPALVEKSPNFKLSFFLLLIFYFLSLIMAILLNIETCHLKENHKTSLHLVKNVI